LVRSGIKLPPDQQIKVPHAELDQEQEADHLPNPQHLCSSSQTKGFSLGIRMRLVPPVHTLADVNSTIKVQHLRAHQGHFLCNLGNCTSHEMLSLDFNSHHLHGHSSRETVVDSTLADCPEQKLFVSIGKHFSGTGCTFHFLLKHDQEANQHITNLLPCLCHTLPGMQHQELEKCFSPSDAAVERAQNCVWDVKKGCIVLEQDKILDNLV